MFNKLLFTLLLSVTVFISGCGGGSASTSVGISGKVIDGYIQGATVCLDLNKNGVCDTGEPSSSTDAAGNYSLSYSGSTTGLQVLSSIPTTAYDADDNGQTLAQAGKSAFTLMAPAPTSNSTDTHVTPLSTLVSSQMLSSGGSSANTAASAVLNNLGMSQTTDLLNTDYVATGKTNQHALAQVVAAAIGAAQSSIASNSTFASTAANGSAQAGLVAIQYVIPSVVSSLVDNSTGSLKSSLGSTTAAISTATSTATSLASSNAASLAATTNLPATQSTLTLKSVLTTGFIVAQADKGNQYIDSNGNVQTYNTTQLQASYSSFNGSNFTSKQKVLIGGAWYNTFTDGTDYDLTSNGWVAEPKSSGPGGADAATFSDNCLTQNQVTGAIPQQICGKISDVSGITVTKLIPTACTDGTPIANCSTQTFPSGSFTMDINISYPQDTYKVWVNDGSASLGSSNGWDGYGHGVSPTAYTIDSYLAQSVSSGVIQWNGNGCNTGFKFTSYTPGVGGVIQFAKNTSSNGCTNATANFTNAESVNFQIKTVNNEPIVVYVTPLTYSTQNLSDHAPYQIFAAVTRGSETAKTIWVGSFFPKNSVINLPFSGYTHIGSKSILDSYLTMTGQTAFPY